MPTAGNANYTFVVPQNFVSLVSLEVLFVPNNDLETGDTINLDSSYALDGENLTANQETVLGQEVFGSADTILMEDISTVFSSLEPGHLCGFNWKNNNIGSLSILAIKMVYSAI